MGLDLTAGMQFDELEVDDLLDGLMLDTPKRESAFIPGFDEVEAVELHLDFETFSDVDLRTRGLDNYSASPRCEVLMLGWAINDEAPQLWVPRNGRSFADMPKRLRDALLNPNVILCAWNAQFERTILRRVLGIDTDYKRWRCSMVRAMILALPGKLEDCGRVLQLGEQYQKNTDGTRLIRLFCVPHAPTKTHPYERYTAQTHPEDWKKFCAYCLRDVVSERWIDKILARFPIRDKEWEIYALDQKINDRGVPIDVAFVEAAIALVERRKREVQNELDQLTGLANSNSTEQLLPWLKARGYPFSNLKKESVKKALEDFVASMTAECVKALRLRQISARSSVKKFRALLKRVGKDGRLRFNFQMAGAGRTMRWAGRGVQLQNLPRPMKQFAELLDELRDLVLQKDYETLSMFYGEILDILVSLLRAVIAAPPGRKLRVSDLSSIETRLTAWISGCEPLMKVFSDGLCAYKTFATRAYGVAYEAVSKQQRQDSKPAVLGCGYMLSGGEEVGEYPEVVKTGLWGYAEAMGVKLSREESHRLVGIYRGEYAEVKVLWEELVAGAMLAINSRKPVKVGVVEFDIMAPFLRMKLPSGRYIYYLRPQIRTQRIYHPKGSEVDEQGKKFFTKLGISYEGKNKKGQWGRVTTHGGKFTENICQAIGADILCEGMLEADERGFDICGHVHDEEITEADELDIDHTHEALSEVMAIVPPWAEGLLLGAAGYEAAFYRKD